MRGREAELDAALEPAVARRLQSRGATTALALPIGGTSGAVGVLEILRAGSDPFSESERQLLRHVAAQAALALSRAGARRRDGLAGAARHRRRGALRDQRRRRGRARRRQARERRLPRRQRTPALARGGRPARAGRLRRAPRRSRPARPAGCARARGAAPRRRDRDGRRRLGRARGRSPVRALCSRSCCARAGRRSACSSCCSPSASAPTLRAPMSRSPSSPRAWPRHSQPRVRGGVCPSSWQMHARSAMPSRLRASRPPSVRWRPRCG